MRQYSINDVDRMDGHEFEYFCAELLRKNGYDKAEVTPGSGDQGIDVIAYKDGIKFGVQCKCYTSDIGNKAVQEAYSGKEFYGCHIGVVLSNRHFTTSAKELASKNRILLWDRDYLINLLKSAELYVEDDQGEKENDNTDSVQFAENIINIDINKDQPIIPSVDDKKYDVILRVDDKQVIRNAGRRDYTAQQIAMCTGMTKAEALSKMYKSPSILAVNISKSEADRITRPFHSFGCTVYLEESHRTDEDLRAEQEQKIRTAAKSNAIAIPIMIGLSALFAFLTKLCWDNSTDGDLGILIVLFAFLTVFSVLLVIASINGYNKAKEKSSGL